jgi:hypothetical protein
MCVCVWCVCVSVGGAECKLDAARARVCVGGTAQGLCGRVQRDTGTHTQGAHAGRHATQAQQRNNREAPAGAASQAVRACGAVARRVAMLGASKCTRPWRMQLPTHARAHTHTHTHTHRLAGCQHLLCAALEARGVKRSLCPQQPAWSTAALSASPPPPPHPSTFFGAGNTTATPTPQHTRVRKAQQHTNSHQQTNTPTYAHTPAPRARPCCRRSRCW